jgi:hypothetical protein
LHVLINRSTLRLAAYGASACLIEQVRDDMIEHEEQAADRYENEDHPAHGAPYAPLDDAGFVGVFGSAISASFR